MTNTKYLGEQSSDTKLFFELTPDRILTAVEEFGFRCPGRVTQLNSMENRVYEVEVELPDGYEPKSPSERFKIVKFYRPGRWSKQQILEEHEFLADLKRQEIPVVSPLADASGETLRKLPNVDIFVALFPKQGGRCPDELSDEQAERIGRLLARVHNIGASKKAEHRLKLTPAVYGIQNLEFLIGAKLIPQEIVAQYKSTVERLCALTEPLYSGVPLNRVHGDCHFGNILWGSEGPFLVDFDDMVQGPAVQDLWLILPGRDNDARRKMDLLLAGYEQIRDFDRGTLQLVEPLRALRFIHFSAWIGRRWNDPAFQRVFSHYGTPGYWREQLADLQDQLTVIQEGGFSSHQGWEDS